jgi:hypothetical protein
MTEEIPKYFSGKEAREHAKAILDMKENFRNGIVPEGHTSQTYEGLIERRSIENRFCSGCPEYDENQQKRDEWNMKQATEMRDMLREYESKSKVKEKAK